MSFEIRKMTSITGDFLYDPVNMQIVTNDHLATPLLGGRSERKIAEDYAKVTINVIKGCNLSCQYCPYGLEVSGGRAEKMTEETGRAIIDFLCAKFSPDVKLIKISFTSNGEPVLNLNSIEAIKAYARELNKKNSALPQFRFDFATNSLALTDKSLHQLVEDSDQRVFFSVDGYPELHNHIRICSGKNSYETIAHKIQLYKEYSAVSRKKLTSSTVLTAFDDRYDLILTHLSEMGFESIVTRPIRGANDTPLGLNEHSVPVFINGYRNMIDLIEQNMLNGDTGLLFKVCNRYDFFGRLFTALILGEERKQGCPGCPPNYSQIVKYSLVFDINGDVYFPCRDFVGISDYHVGNIFDTVDLDRVGDVMETLKTSCRTECCDCWAHTLCGGGCYNAALLSTRQVDKPDTNLCKIIIYVAERAIKLAHIIASREPELLQRLVIHSRESSPWYHV